MPPSPNLAAAAARTRPGYAASFDQRGDTYDAAMRAYPKARRREFALLFERQPLRPGEVVVDVPSLGGYLPWYFPGIGRVINLDFAATLRPGVRCVSPTGRWDLPEAVSRVVCLAALHHLEDLGGFLTNLRDQIAPGVRLHLADVGHGSRIGQFLDTVVDAYTRTGHRGHYRDWQQQSFPAGLAVTAVRREPCPWILPDAAAAARFCQLLFGLEGLDGQTLLQELEQIVGLEHHGDGTLSILWELTYVDLVRI
ncbi:MAG: hypothetical protein VKJ05_05910 [Synechococcaceae cyanobacterium]|nr:hypothetical protein [Synechococcaceae cyanobacterium]